MTERHLPMMHITVLKQLKLQVSEGVLREGGNNDQIVRCLYARLSVGFVYESMYSHVHSVQWSPKGFLSSVFDFFKKSNFRTFCRLAAIQNLPKI